MLPLALVQRSTPPADEAESTRVRLTFLALLVVTLFVLLFARLWFLQVMAGSEFAGLAEGNAVRTVSLEAPRGRILDRNGEAIVENRYAFVVGVQPSELPEEEDEAQAVLADLADLLGESVEDLEHSISSSRSSPLRPRPVAVDVPEDTVLYIWENQSTRYPGVYAELLPQREYPHGDVAAHTVGYLGEISAEELESERYEHYQPGDVIGWAGVERTYEDTLRGEEGLRRLEVNPRGDVLRQLDEVLPTPGADLRLTLDLDVQQATEEALREGIEEARRTPDERGIAPTLEAPGGGVVVIDADTGEVHALASYPTFHPEEFVGGVSQDYYSGLLDSENDFPLINRAIQSSYPPGSVYKIVTAYAALEEGFISPDATLPCPARWEWNEQVFTNWSNFDSGEITMAQSLVESCNTVYYELARRIWNAEESGDGDEEILTAAGEKWGFGATQGIDLPSERAGVVPGRTWKRQFWESARDGYCAQAAAAADGSYEQRLYEELCSEQGARWRGGDAVNMSTGQGDVQTTPLQVANSFAAVANGGTLHTPRVGLEAERRDGTVDEIDGPLLGELGVSDSTLSVLRNGLEGVTSRGTAESVFSDFPTTIAGKTGTAEFGKSRQPFAWFGGYNVAEHDDRRFAVVALVEEGGGGSQTAAPIVRRVFEELLGYEATEIEAGESTE